MVDSASNRNEYQRASPLSKGGRCVRLTTLLPSCAAYLKNLGSVNLLEPSGVFRPVQGQLYLTDLEINIL